MRGYRYNGKERKTELKTKKKQAKFAGSPWQIFNLKELYTFMGILLRGGLSYSFIFQL